MRAKFAIPTILAAFAVAGCVPSYSIGVHRDNLSILTAKVTQHGDFDRGVEQQEVTATLFRHDPEPPFHGWEWVSQRSASLSPHDGESTEIEFYHLNSPGTYRITVQVNYHYAKPPYDPGEIHAKDYFTYGAREGLTNFGEEPPEEGSGRE